MKLWIVLGAVLVIVIIVVANINRRGGGKLTVQTEKVGRGDITSKVSGSAKIMPEIQVKISAKVSGQIVDLGVVEGQSVSRGQFLVQLDPEYYQGAEKQAQSNLDYARAGFVKAKNEFERAEKLFDDNLASQAELDIAKSTFEQSMASVKQAEAALSQARDDLAKTTIKSPMNGIVSKLNKKVGEMAMGSQFTLDEIMVVSDLERMMAETEIDENDVVKVSVGDTAEVMVDAFPDSTFRGVVREIANTGQTVGAGSQEEVTNFLVKVSLLDLPGGLRPGMSATVDIMTETRRNAIKIPIQCVTAREPVSEEEKEKRKKGGGEADTDTTAPDLAEATEDSRGRSGETPKPVTVVFVVRDGVAHQTEVKTGIQSDTEWEITDGIEEGQEVVSGSYRILSKQIRDGSLVKVDNSKKDYDQKDD